MPKKTTKRKVSKNSKKLSVLDTVKMRLGKYFYPILGLTVFVVVAGAGSYLYVQSRTDAAFGPLPNYTERLRCGTNQVPARGGGCVPKPRHPGCPPHKIPVNGGGCVPRPAANAPTRPTAGQSAGNAAAEAAKRTGERVARQGKALANRDRVQGGGSRTGNVQAPLPVPQGTQVRTVENIARYVPVVNPDGDIRVVTYLDDPNIKGDENKRLGGVAIKITKDGNKPSCATHKSGKGKTNSKGYINRKADNKKILVKGTVNFIGCDTGSYKVVMEGRKGYKIKGTSITETVNVEDDKTTEVKFVLQKEPKASTNRPSGGSTSSRPASSSSVEQCNKRKAYTMGFQADLARFKKNHYDEPTDLSPYAPKQRTNVDGKKVSGRTASGNVDILKAGVPAKAMKTNYALVLDYHRINREIAEKGKVNTGAYNNAIVQLRNEISTSGNNLVTKYAEWGARNPAAVDCNTAEGRAQAFQLSKERAADIKEMSADLKKVQAKSKAATSEFSKAKSEYRRKNR